MTKQIKIGLYIVLTVAGCVFGYLTYTTYNQVMEQAPERAEADSPEVSAVESKGEGSSGYARMLTFAGLFFVSIVTLGVLFGHDASHFVGNRFLKMIYNDDEKAQGSPDYEQAEQVWADGDHLEAIRLMREYLLKNPREQHVALRIAEIYEKDLQNHLAAALEYEEILKQRLPAEQWGWAAIHLCNLYFKLNKPDKAVEWLRRIDAEHPETAAAEKARKRLALYDSGEAEASVEGKAPADER